jgi:xylan 1,4-beta-xylosidase
MQKHRLFVLTMTLLLTGGILMNACSKKPATPPTDTTVTPTIVATAVIKKNPTTFCNPINIGYQYQTEYKGRESADPAAIMFKGDYYLFASHSSGYWWSNDLVNWNFIYVKTSQLAEIDNFAPGVCVIGDYIYIAHSGGNSVFKSSDPKTGEWEYVNNPTWWLDPALFTDDDGRVYSYYGGSNMAPLYVVELDPESMSVIDGPVSTFSALPASHGFEVPGDRNTAYTNDCWMEGAWVTKHDGKYYLQYAAPGTEYASYANGCYVSDKPMGPFTYQENSPISYKATGFVAGAGHGSTIQDKFGKWWKFDTVSISVNHPFERRLAMYPASFDKYGQMVSNLVLADYPMYYPSADFNFDKPNPDWNLLSYGKTAKSSSILVDRLPTNAFDENMRTWWSATTGDVDEWLMVDLGKLCAVNALQINFADQDITPIGGRGKDFRYRYYIEFSQDGEKWYPLVDQSKAVGVPLTDSDKSHEYFELESVIGARYVRVTNKGEVPAGGKFAISGLRLFGNGGGVAPKEVTDFTVARNVDDERSADIKWTASEGAEGYIIRYGNKEDSKYIHYQVIKDTKVSVYNLNLGVDYFFTIDAYNDSGFTKGNVTQKCVSTVPAIKMPTDLNNQAVLKNSEPNADYTIYQAEGDKFNKGFEIAQDTRANNSSILNHLKTEKAYFEISNVDSGEWTEGNLRLAFANGNGYAEIEVFVNSKSQGIVKLPTTGSWQHYRMVEIPVVNLKPGANNTIKVVMKDQGINPDYIQLIY